jgi:hypothetical protein
VCGREESTINKTSCSGSEERKRERERDREKMSGRERRRRTDYTEKKRKIIRSWGLSLIK